jgi:tripeptide aminopeptidase
MSDMEFPGLLDRFLKYVKIDTQSEEGSKQFPSTKKQFNLLNVLKTELETIGMDEVKINKWGYVTATLKSNRKEKTAAIALIAHVDTSPDVSGENVNPQIHKNYNGRDITLAKNGKVIMKVNENPYLKEKRGKTIITTDGTTLLGSDDKAGIAEIMTAIEYLINNPQHPRPKIRVIFTPDEEVGRGTEHITAEQIAADYGYTIDGGKLGEIEDETFSADTVEIKITGVNVHPGYAKNKLVNAIKICAEILEEFPKDRLSPETTEKRQGYVHPYQITGGCEEVILKILIRDFEEKGLLEKEAFLKNIVDSKSTRYPKAKIDFKVIESYRNMKTVLAKYPEVIDKALKAIKMAGIKPLKNIVRGGTDGSKLSFMGLPTPNIFTGGSNFHSKYEWIALEDMHKAVEVIINLMKLWATA